MTRGYFVTGTGTGVGKTFVTAMLAEQARALGHRVFAFKPIETGCVAVNGRWVGADQEVLAQAAGDWQQGDLRHLYCFERPASPLAAAQTERQTIELERIIRVFEQGAVGADLVLVEGAGGWRVPITTSADMSTLASRLGLPVLVVALAGLGTINHSLLTVEAIRRDGLEVAGVVLSVRPEDDPELTSENAREIHRRTRVAVETTRTLHVKRL